MNTVERNLFYCNLCNAFFDTNLAEEFKYCPTAYCKGCYLNKINGKLYHAIIELNQNRYFVLDASVERDRIYMVIDGIHHFKNAPKDFVVEHVYDAYDYSIPEMDGTCENEPFTRLDYVETIYNKTEDELDSIVSNIGEWVNALCGYEF
ncbi:MAG: hypothetical protein FWC89_00700 [Defluviitaleaceae bacterium]|nr:hypothetical protein [Defluviitaleaceae bacterium]